MKRWLVILASLLPLLAAAQGFPERPVRIEYHLTEKGRALDTVIATISDWAAEWLVPPECKGNE